MLSWNSTSSFSFITVRLRHWVSHCFRNFLLSNNSFQRYHLRADFIGNKKDKTYVVGPHFLHRVGINVDFCTTCLKENNTALLTWLAILPLLFSRLKNEGPLVGGLQLRFLSLVACGMWCEHCIRRWKTVWFLDRMGQSGCWIKWWGWLLLIRVRQSSR